MLGENDDNLDLETPNEGLEAEADASDQDGQDAEVGADAEGSAEGDGADAEVGQEVDGEPRRPSRGEARFQTLSKTAREANERAARLETESRDLRERLARLEQPRQQQPQGPSAEQIALMTPQEYADHKFNAAQARFDEQLRGIQFSNYEQNDLATWRSITATDPNAARLAPTLEQRLAEMRRQGQNVDRERLYTYLIGEEVRAKSATAKTKQAGDGQRRIQRQQTRPSGGQRSDTAPSRGKMSEAEARAKRLENATF